MAGFRMCLHGRVLRDSEVRTIRLATNADLIDGGIKRRLVTQDPPSPQVVRDLEDQFGVDINVLPPDFDPDRIRLVVSDMDSTFVTIECIDELADMIGIKDQVSAITESAMRGEIDFSAALRQRVALLEGLPVERLEAVYRERLKTSPGVERLLASLKERGISMALVSGGFTYFTDRLCQDYELFGSRANVLQAEDGLLTGRISGSIVNGAAKAAYLLEVCGELGIECDQSIAVGDGANDLAMMDVAGLSIAYRAKKTVQQSADMRLNRSGLDGICDVFETWGA